MSRPDWEPDEPSQDTAVETSASEQSIDIKRSQPKSQDPVTDPLTPPEAVSKAHPRACRLENLPAEIRRHLLSISPLPVLKALVHASPTFHQQYLIDRYDILRESLDETLGSVAIDAYFVHLFETQSDDPKKTDVYGILKLYTEKLFQRSPILTTLAQDELKSLARYYLSFVQDILKDYINCTLENLASQLDCVYCSRQVSRIETLRFTRAIYRFQLLCQVENSGNASIEPKLSHFLRALDSWEIEELFAFYRHVEDFYNGAFGTISWDVDPENPVFQDQDTPNTPEGAFWLNVDCERSFYKEGTALQGLPLLQKGLETDDHEDLVKVMQEEMTQSDIPLNGQEGSFGREDQARRRARYLTERDEKQERRVPLPFQGDTDSGKPPLAWTIIWKDTYSNLYGYYVDGDEEEFKWWGYVFWDAKRLRETGMIEVIQKSRDRMWEREFDGKDPRDTVDGRERIYGDASEDG